jgi:hypothetical protein
MVACHACQNWHREGKHTADAATRRENLRRLKAQGGRYLPNAIELPSRSGEILGYEAQGETLEVKKLKPGEYFAKVLGTQRGRFGDSEQIREDIAHFLETGALPRSKSNWY